MRASHGGVVQPGGALVGRSLGRSLLDHLALDMYQVLDAKLGQARSSSISSRLKGRPRLCPALRQSAIARADDVHINFGPRVFVIFKINNGVPPTMPTLTAATS